MTSDPNVSRRVTRLENDTESIYELITEVRSTQDEHTRRFDRIENTLNEVVRRLALLSRPPRLSLSGGSG